MSGGGGQLTADNRPLPNPPPRPLYQNEVEYSTFDMEMSFILMQIKLMSEGFWN